MAEMTPRERFIAALKREPMTGLVPHFEMVFFLTMEAFHRVHPSHRFFSQWDQMSLHEQMAQFRDVAEVYVQTAEHYGHSAIFVQAGPDNSVPYLEQIREISGNQYYIMLHGDATYEIPNGDNMLEFTYRMADDQKK